MHLLIPFASALSGAADHVLQDVPLPNLGALLTRLTPANRDEADEYVPSPPHERALAAAWGWRGAPGALPFAAQAAAMDGIDTLDLAWGMLTPVHWHVGRDHITLLDPQSLQLEETESRTFLEAVRPLFESEGFALVYGAPTRWYAAHESFTDLPCASLDRVVGRNVDLWLHTDAHAQPRARLIRRLQNEVQMLLYPHPLNEAREARGALPVNSFWLSGCGMSQPADLTAVQVDDRLRTPALTEDWPAWAAAWRALDAGPLATLLGQARRSDSLSLTLCGERTAQRLDNQPQSLWQRLSSPWKKTEPHAFLKAL
jgi:hypothetical protein